MCGVLPGSSTPSNRAGIVHKVGRRNCQQSLEPHSGLCAACMVYKLGQWRSAKVHQVQPLQDALLTLVGS